MRDFESEAPIDLVPASVGGNKRERNEDLGVARTGRSQTVIDKSEDEML
jgi:hypothetical protein